MSRSFTAAEEQVQQPPSGQLVDSSHERRTDSQQPQLLAATAPVFSPLAGTLPSAPPTLMRFPASRLTINQPGDRYEQEADRIADRIMSMPTAEATRQVGTASDEQPQIQRKCASCEEEEEKNKVHRKETAAGPATAPTIVHEALRSRVGLSMPAPAPLWSRALAMTSAG